MVSGRLLDSIVVSFSSLLAQPFSVNLVSRTIVPLFPVHHFPVFYLQEPVSTRPGNSRYWFTGSFPFRICLKTAGKIAECAWSGGGKTKKDNRKCWQSVPSANKIMTLWLCSSQCHYVDRLSKRMLDRWSVVACVACNQVVSIEIDQEMIDRLSSPDYRSLSFLSAGIHSTRWCHHTLHGSRGVHPGVIRCLSLPPLCLLLHPHDSSRRHLSVCLFLCEKRVSSD